MLKQLLEHSLCNHHSSKMQTFIPKGIYANNFDVSGRMLSSAAGMDSQNRCKMKTNVLWDPDSPYSRCGGCRVLAQNKLFESLQDKF